MIHHLMLKILAGSRNKRNPIYAEVERGLPRDRDDGGLYRSGGPKYMIKIVAVRVAISGRDQKTLETDGVDQSGMQVFQVPYSELTKLGLSRAVIPGLRIVQGSAVFVVMDFEMLDREYTCRLITIRSRDVATISNTWDFEDDVVGGVPEEWTINDETYDDTGTRTLQIVEDVYDNTTKFVKIDNEDQTEHTQMVLPVLDHVFSSCVKVTYRTRVHADNLSTDGHLAFDFMGMTDDDNVAYTAYYDVESGELLYRWDSYFSFDIVPDEWYTITWSINVIADTITVTVLRESDDTTETTTIDRGDIVGYQSDPGWYVVFSGNRSADSGTPGYRLIDDVEVSCVVG